MGAGIFSENLFISSICCIDNNARDDKIGTDADNKHQNKGHDKMRATIINPESSYFGMTGEIQRTPEQAGGRYRIGLLVEDRHGIRSHMHWHFLPSEIEIN